MHRIVGIGAVLFALLAPAAASAGGAVIDAGLITSQTGFAAALHGEYALPLGATLRGSLMYGKLSSDGEEKYAGGKLFAPTLGLYRSFFHESPFQPFLAGGAGYGWLWRDPRALARGWAGEEGKGLVWYAEVGSEMYFIFSGAAVCLSVRVIDHPNERLWMFPVSIIFGTEKL